MLSAASEIPLLREEIKSGFSGVLPADTEQFVEMVATVRTTDAHEVTVETDGGRTGRTWDCPDLPVEASVVDGTGFEGDTGGCNKLT